MYDYLHKQKGAFKLPSVLKVAVDVSKGMNYLHQNNIIHRDLKAANLLMDENEVRRASIFSRLFPQVCLCSFRFILVYFFPLYFVCKRIILVVACSCFY